MLVIRRIARFLSIILVGGMLIIFIGHAIEGAQQASPEPMSLYSMVQLAIWGIGLIFLLLAWKWELAAGLAAFISFGILFLVNHKAFTLTMMPFPLDALLFLMAAMGGRKKRQLQP